MTKQVQKSNKGVVTISKETTIEELRELLKKNWILDAHPKRVIEKYRNVLFELHSGKKLSKKRKEELKKQCKDLEVEKARIFNLDSRLHLVNSIPKSDKYAGYAIELCEELEKEYNVTTSSQKLIVQKIVSAEIRLLYYQGFCGNTLTGTLFASISERAKADNHINRAIDLAYRQIQTGLEQLKLITSPPIKVKLVQEKYYTAGEETHEKKKVVQEFSNPKKQ